MTPAHGYTYYMVAYKKIVSSDSCKLYRPIQKKAKSIKKRIFLSFLQHICSKFPHLQIHCTEKMPNLSHIFFQNNFASQSDMLCGNNFIYLFFFFLRMKPFSQVCKVKNIMLALTTLYLGLDHLYLETISPVDNYHFYFLAEGACLHSFPGYFPFHQLTYLTLPFFNALIKKL